MDAAGISSKDLEFVLINHGHEDHDGGLAVLLGDEAIVVGDVVLPDISPWPTRQALFAEVAEY
jgi:metal-dependent hydrolase (beta-lactamase superfamily II)